MHSDMARGIAVEDQLRAWEMVTHGEYQRPDLFCFEIHENPFSQKQEGAPGMHAHRLQPGALEHRAAYQMITLPSITDELPAQFDDFRQIQVIPLDLAIIHALEARIEAAPDVNHHPFRIARQKI